MNPDDIQGLIRHVLTAAGGALVTDGMLTSGQLSDLVGALMVLGGVGWSLFQKAAQRKALAAAKAAPATV